MPIGGRVGQREQFLRCFLEVPGKTRAIFGNRAAREKEGDSKGLSLKAGKRDWLAEFVGEMVAHQGMTGRGRTVRGREGRLLSFGRAFPPLSSPLPWGEGDRSGCLCYHRCLGNIVDPALVVVDEEAK